MTKDEALKMCLEYIETSAQGSKFAILIKEALAQRTWVGLTDNEIEKMGLSNYIKVVRETEAKLKEKNT